MSILTKVKEVESSILMILPTTFVAWCYCSSEETSILTFLSQFRDIWVITKFDEINPSNQTIVGNLIEKLFNHFKPSFHIRSSLFILQL